MEEVQLNPVNTPRVRSRAEAWLAWEAAMKAKYSKIRKKIEKTKNKELLEFQAEIEGEYRKLWMYIHDTRPRRKELLLETQAGVKEWVSLADVKRSAVSSKWMIHPDYEFYRKRQEYLIENGFPDWRRNSVNDFVFHEGFHDHELTPEELAKRQEEQELAYQQWKTENEARVAKERLEEALRQERLDAEIRKRQIQLVAEWKRSWLSLERPISRHDLLSSTAMFRLFYLISRYHEIDQITLDILAASIVAIDTRLTRESSVDLVTMVLGYPDLQTAIDSVELGIIKNLNPPS